jgi:hypothetical protein
MDARLVPTSSSEGQRGLVGGEGERALLELLA